MGFIETCVRRVLRESTAGWDAQLRYGWISARDIATLANVKRRDARRFLARAVDEGVALARVSSWRIGAEDDGVRYRWASGKGSV